MHYYAKIVREDGAYIVSFPDFPNVNTYGSTIARALHNASEALNGAVETDFERGFSMPEPSRHEGRQYHAVELAPHLEIAFSLRKLREGRSQKEIARQLGITYQALQKLENPRRANPSIKTLERIAAVFGKRLRVAFV